MERNDPTLDSAQGESAFFGAAEACGNGTPEDRSERGGTGRNQAARTPAPPLDSGDPARFFYKHLVGCLGEIAFQDAVNAWLSTRQSREHNDITWNAECLPDGRDGGFDFEFHAGRFGCPGWRVDVKTHAVGIRIRRRPWYPRSDVYVRAAIDPSTPADCLRNVKTAKLWARREDFEMTVVLVGWIDVLSLQKRIKSGASIVRDSDLAQVGQFPYGIVCRDPRPGTVFAGRLDMHKIRRSQINRDGRGIRPLKEGQHFVVENGRRRTLAVMRLSPFDDPGAHDSGRLIAA